MPTATRSIHSNLRGSTPAPGATLNQLPPPPPMITTPAAPRIVNNPPAAAPTTTQPPAQQAQQTQQDGRKYLPGLPPGFEWVPKLLQPGEQPSNMQVHPEARLPAGWQWTISQIIPPAPQQAGTLPLNHPVVQGVLMRTPEKLADKSCPEEASAAANIGAAQSGTKATAKKRGIGAMIGGVGIGGLAAVAGVAAVTGVGGLIFWVGLFVYIYDHEQKNKKVANSQKALVQNQWNLHSHIVNTHPNRTYRPEQVY